MKEKQLRTKQKVCRKVTRNYVSVYEKGSKKLLKKVCKKSSKELDKKVNNKSSWELRNCVFKKSSMEQARM